MNQDSWYSLHIGHDGRSEPVGYWNVRNETCQLLPDAPHTFKS